MPTFKKRNLIGVSPSSPPLAPLTGGQLAKSDRVGSIFARQDRVLGHGRRILASGGRNMSTSFQVPGTVPLTLTQTHPSPTAERECGRIPIMDLAPGHWPRLSLICVPSGQTQKPIVIGDTDYWAPAGAGGHVLVTCVFNNGVDSETVTREISPPVSGNVYNAESAFAGATFAQLHRLQSELIAPVGVESDPATLAKWSDGVTVTATIAYVGGVRIIDWTLAEEPYKYARSLFTSDWAGSLYTNGSGEPLTAYPSKYPVSYTNLGGDVSGGTDFLLDTIARQAALGPVLLSQSTYDERGQAVTSTAPDPVSTSSLTYVDLFNQSVTTYSEAAAGWSLASGANAAQWNTAGPCLELRGEERVVPCRVSVYARRAAGSGVCTMRLAGSAYSVAEITVNSSTWNWYDTDAHMICGFGPAAGESSNVILFGKVASLGATLEVRYLQVTQIDA